MHDHTKRRFRDELVSQFNRFTARFTPATAALLSKRFRALLADDPKLASRYFSMLKKSLALIPSKLSLKVVEQVLRDQTVQRTKNVTKPRILHSLSSQTDKSYEKVARDFVERKNPERISKKKPGFWSYLMPPKKNPFGLATFQKEMHTREAIYLHIEGPELTDGQREQITKETYRYFQTCRKRFRQLAIIKNPVIKKTEYDKAGQKILYCVDKSQGIQPFRTLAKLRSYIRPIGKTVTITLFHHVENRLKASGPVLSEDLDKPFDVHHFSDFITKEKCKNAKHRTRAKPATSAYHDFKQDAENTHPNLMASMNPKAFHQAHVFDGCLGSTQKMYPSTAGANFQQLTNTQVVNFALHKNNKPRVKIAAEVYKSKDKRVPRKIEHTISTDGARCNVNMLKTTILPNDANYPSFAQLSLVNTLARLPDAFIQTFTNGRLKKPGCRKKLNFDKEALASVKVS